MIRFNIFFRGVLYNESYYRCVNQVLTSAHRLESTVSEGAKAELGKQLIAIKEECRGQGLDLADMADAIKMASNSFHSTWKKADIHEAKIQGKVVTLSSSLKSYSMRLANLQNESRCIQSEAETLNKMLNSSNVENGTAKFSDKLPYELEFANVKSTANTDIDHNSNNQDKCNTSNTQKYTSTEELEANNSNFTVEKPRLAEVLENCLPTKPQQHTDEMHKQPIHVEERRERTEQHHSPEEIDINAIEIEPLLPDVGSAKEVSEETEGDNLTNISINDITRELFERGIDFTDCNDEITLRQRYKEKIIEADKKVNCDSINSRSESSSHATKASQNASSSPSSLHNNKNRKDANQPPLPTKPDNFTQQQQYYEKHQPPSPPPPYSQNNSTGLVSDPYPNGERKMFDAGKYIWQIKQEIAAEKNVSADMIELWCNKVCLADPMRLCDYPNAQSFPIEVHQKGYVPYEKDTY